MATQKRDNICDQICRKIGLTRKKPHHPNLDKRELLHVSSALDTVQNLKKEALKDG